MHNVTGKEAVAMAPMDQTEIAYRFGKVEARLNAIEDNLRELASGTTRLLEKIDEMNRRADKRLADMDRVYARKEGCVRNEAVTKRDVFVLSTAITIAINVVVVLINYIK